MTRLPWRELSEASYLSRREQYVELNFHDPDLAGRLRDVLAGGPGKASFLLLIGPAGVGRKYLIDATAYQLREAQVPIDVVHVDLSNAEPDAPGIEPLVQAIVAKYGAAQRHLAESLLRLGHATSVPVIPGYAVLEVQVAAALGLALSPLLKLFAAAGGQARPARERLALLLEYVTTNRRVVLDLPFEQTDLLLRETLARFTRELPGLSVVFTVDAPPHEVRLEPDLECARFELHHLSRVELRETVVRCLERSQLPEDVFDVLYSSTCGARPILAVRLLDWRRKQLLDWDDENGWVLRKHESRYSGWPLDLLEAVWSAIETLRARVGEETYRSMLRLLRLGALCGQRFPASYLTRFMGLDGASHARFAALIRTEVIERAELLKGWWLECPEFPQSVVYTFAAPTVQEALLRDLGQQEMKRDAAELLRFLEMSVGIHTRGLARLCMGLARHAYPEDDERLKEYERRLSWWISLDRANEFELWAKEQVRTGKLDAELLWRAFAQSEGQLPLRRLVFLRAYAGQPNGIPYDRQGDVSYHLGHLNEEIGALAEAERCFSEALEHFRRTKGEDDEAALVSRAAVAAVWSKQGHPERGLRELTQVLDRARRALGHDHVTTLAVWHELLAAKQKLDVLEKTVEELEQLVALKSRVLGENHGRTLASLHLLASVLSQKGRRSDAARVFKDVLARKRATLGEYHQSTLITQHHLACVLERTGELKSAEDEFTAVLAHRRETLGEDHPDTLTTRHSLARLWAKEGFLERALHEYDEVQERQLRVHGEDHPETLLTQENRACLLGRLGKLEAAEREFAAVLKRRVRLMGEDDRATLQTRTSLACTWARLGRLADAERELAEVLKRQEGLLGRDHPATLRTWYELAELKKMKQEGEWYWSGWVGPCES